MKVSLNTAIVLHTICAMLFTYIAYLHVQQGKTGLAVLAAVTGGCFVVSSIMNFILMMRQRRND